MSFWAKIRGVKVEDLSCFQAACQKNHVDYVANKDVNFHMNGDPVVATLIDQKGRTDGHSKAYLVRSGGAIHLEIDNDINYSSLSNRLGQNGGVLMRDYVQNVITDNVMSNDGFVNMVEETADGGVLLRVSTL